jgi:hypothetical protein
LSPIKATDLGFSSSTRVKTFYVEAVRETSNLAGAIRI